MNVRGIFKDSPVFVQLSLLLGLLIFGVFFGSTVFYIISFAMGIPSDALSTNVDCLRMMQFWVSLFSFFVPACLLAQLFSEDVGEYLQLSPPPLSSVVLTVLSIVLALPFLNLAVHLNEQVVFPESLRSLETSLKAIEDNAQRLTQQLLQTESLSLFLFNLLIFAVLAGVGEEFFFRGVMQRVVGKAIANPHVVIWIVALLFSVLHFQFYGLAPRMLLGAMMGYLLLWTRSIWVPVVAHFTNNLIAVLAYYYVPEVETQERLNKLGLDDTLWLSAVSLSLVLLTMWIIKTSSAKPIR